MLVIMAIRGKSGKKEAMLKRGVQRVREDPSEVSLKGPGRETFLGEEVLGVGPLSEQSGKILSKVWLYALVYLSSEARFLLLPNSLSVQRGVSGDKAPHV